MRTIRTKVYKFDELSKQAKENAIETWRNNESFEFEFGEAWDVVQKFADRFDIEMRDFDFLESYRSHYSFNAKDEVLELSGFRLRTYLINNYYDLLYERKEYGKYEKRANGKWSYDRYSKCQVQETCCPFTGMSYDEDILNPIREFIKKPNSNDFKDLLEDCLSAICKSVEDQIKWLNEDEQITETIEANEYEFTRDGKMI